MEALPVLSTSPTFNDLVYVNVKFVECRIRMAVRDRRDITWNSVEGITNRVEVSTNLSAGWTTFSEVLGTGDEMTVSDTSPQTDSHLYRVQLRFP